MAVQPVPTLTGIPPFPQTSDRASGTYNSKALAFGNHMADTFNDEFEALADNVHHNATEAATAAATLSGAADTATAAAIAASADRALAQTAAGTATSKAGETSADRVLSQAAATAASNSASQAAAAAVGAQAIVLGVSTTLPALRPSLLLDFANSRQVDPRITFTSASTATYYDAQGVLRTAASGVPRIDHDPVTGECKGLLIEEARTNLFTYSEQFDNAAWTKGNASILANAAIAPDGQMTAGKLVANTVASAAHTLTQNCSLTSGQPYTITIFLAAAGRSECIIGFDPGSAFSTFQYARFNLLTGTGSVFLGSPTFSIASVGGGWFRCSVTATAVTTGWTTCSLQPHNGTSNVYTGDGTSGLYIWGAQLEVGSFPTSYIPSSVTFTGRASAGSYFGSDGLLKTAASGEARMNYNPTNLTIAPKLLLEEARTNLLRYSGDRLNAAWTSSFINGSGGNFWTVTASTEVGTPGDVGTVHKYVATSTTQGLFARQQRTFDAGKSYVASLWVYVPVGAGVNNFVCNVNFSDIEGANSLATSEFGKWVRLSSVIQALAATRSYVDFELFLNAGSNPSSGFTFYATAFQLEEIPAGSGSYPTSYIKTEAAQVTRAADTSTSAQTTRTADRAVMTGTNFSSWYRQDEGTFVAFARRDALSAGRLITLSDGTSGNQIWITLIVSSTSLRADLEVTVGGVLQVSTTTTPVVAVGSMVAIAFAYKANDFAISVNGTTVVTDTSGLLPIVDRVHIGTDRTGANSHNGHIPRIAYYPKRLLELQSLSAQ